MFNFCFGKWHEQTFTSDKDNIKDALSDFYNYMDDIHNYLKCGGLFGDYSFFVDDGLSVLGNGDIIHRDFYTYGG